MTTLRPYPEYKSSGVEWLGDVPNSWEVRRLKHCGARVLGGATPKSDDDTFWNGDVVWVTPEDLSRADEIFGSRRTLTEKGLASCAAQLVPAGSLIVTCRAPIGNLAIARVPLATNQGCKTIVLDGKTLQGSYLFATLSTGKRELQSLGTGTTFAEVSTADVSGFPLPLPPLDEQRAIADFLDAMDAKITRFIAARRRMIALLDEQKQAIITQAVTRGLDPDVPLKPSGIDWLGDIPAHWEVLPLGRLVSIAGGMTPSKGNIGYWTGTVPWISPKDMKSSRITSAVDYISEQAVRETGLALVPLQSLLVVVRGMILARKVPVAVTDIPLTINQDMKALIPKAGINADFLARLLEVAQDALFPLIDEAGHGTRRLPTPALLGLQLAIPPESEQRLIVDFIDRANSKIVRAAKRSVHEIELIQEYRTRLISDVATGKLDVRGIELPALEEIVDAGVEVEPSESILEEEVIDASPAQ